MKKSELIKIIKEETNFIIKQLSENTENLKKDFVQRVNAKLKKLKAYNFPNEERPEKYGIKQIQDVEIEDGFIELLHKWSSTQTTEDPAKAIDLIATLLAKKLKEGKESTYILLYGLETKLKELLTQMMKKAKKPKTPQMKLSPLIVTGNTAKAKLIMPKNISFDPYGKKLEKIKKQVNAYIKQLKNEHGGQWKFSGTKGEFAIFNKQ